MDESTNQQKKKSRSEKMKKGFQNWVKGLIILLTLGSSACAPSSGGGSSSTPPAARVVEEAPLLDPNLLGSWEYAAKECPEGTGAPLHPETLTFASSGAREQVIDFGSSCVATIVTTYSGLVTTAAWNPECSTPPFELEPGYSAPSLPDLPISSITETELRIDAEAGCVEVYEKL